MKEIGRYRIQSVATVTGVSAATLRAWERRYGIPAPQRTNSAYRLYTDRDVEMIRRLRGLCEQGMAPSQAAQMIRAARSFSEEMDGLESNTVHLAVQKILAGVERFDADVIETAVRYAMFLGPATTLFDRVFGPVLTEIGDRWHAGTMNVGHALLASEIIGAAIRDLLRMVRPASPAHTAVLACFADDEHVLPVLGVALTLNEWNIRTVVLGARTPPSVIRQAVAEIGPDLVCLSVMMPVPSSHAAPLLSEYADACGRTPLLVGGQGSYELRDLIETYGGTVAPASRVKLRAVLAKLTNSHLYELPALSADSG